MRNPGIFAFAALAALVTVLALPTGSVAADVAASPAAVAGAKHRVILQVSDDNPKTWNQALNGIENLQQVYGKQNVDVELVAFGFGLGILKLDSVAGSRVLDALQSGANIVACEVTMRRQKLTKADLLPNLSYAPSGLVEIITRQKEGWIVVRP